jgi:hypothetical protein
MPYLSTDVDSGSWNLIHCAISAPKVQHFAWNFGGLKCTQAPTCPKQFNHLVVPGFFSALPKTLDLMISHHLGLQLHLI